MWWLRIFGFKAFSFCEALGFLVVISFFFIIIIYGKYLTLLKSKQTSYISVMHTSMLHNPQHS